MSISSEISALNIDITNFYNSDAVFTPSTGSVVSCRVELSKEVDPQAISFDGKAWTQMTTIEALLSTLGKEPDSGETFTIDSTTYTVKKVVENDGYFVKVAVK